MKKRIEKLGWTYPTVDGALYIFPKTGKDSWPFALDLIKKARVATVPGEPFGPSGKFSLRFCFGSANLKDIDEGFDKIEKYLGK